MVVGGWYLDYSVSLLAQFLSGSRLGLISLVTRLAKALLGQVGDQVDQVRDQVGQGQGQELDNYLSFQSILVRGYPYPLQQVMTGMDDWDG